MAGIRIYVHGRPQGQDIWSPKDDATDHFYLEPFLDSRVGGDVQSAMIVDVWQKHIYYTYIRCKTVIEKTQRPNAYFAITIRFDDVYTKNVSTLYNLLERVYNKVCLGNLITSEDGQERFVVSQLSEKSVVLQQMASIISQNVEKVIAPTFSALSVSSDTNETAPKLYSLNDVDSPVFITDSFKHRVVVSPYYKSKDKLHEEDLQRLQPLEAECAKLHAALTQWKDKHAALEAEKTSLLSELKTVKSKCDDLQHQIQTIKDEAAKQYSEEIQRLQSLLTSREKELNVARQQIISLSEELKKLRERVPSPSPIEPGNVKTNELAQELLRRMAERFPSLDGNVHKGHLSILPKISSYCAISSCVISLAAICVLVAYVIFPPMEVTSQGVSQSEYDAIYDKASALETRCSSLEQSLFAAYSAAKVDIAGLNGESLSKGKPYTCSVKGMVVTIGRWECSENACFDGNKICVQKEGEVTIRCYDSFGNLIKERKINAK